MTQILPEPLIRPREAKTATETSAPAARISWAAKLWERAAEMFGRHTVSEGASAACSQSVRDACLALRLAAIDEAEAILRSAAAGEPRHAGWLNLMGVICESRGDWSRARRLYGKAMRVDRSFAPAEQNMRRWFELFTFGRTTLPVALGDNRAAD